MTIGQEHLKLNSAARRSYDLLPVARDDSRVTLLVNNAGVGTAAPLLNSDVAAMNPMITLNGGLIEVVK